MRRIEQLLISDQGGLIETPWGAETLRCWRTARQAPRTPRGRRPRRTSAPWPGRRRRAWRAPPWPRSCSAAPSWCRWPWAASPSCPRPPQSASCGPWSSWPEMLTILPNHSIQLHSISSGHMVTLTVFVNQLSRLKARSLITPSLLCQLAWQEWCHGTTCYMCTRVTPDIPG